MLQYLAEALAGSPFKLILKKAIYIKDDQQRQIFRTS